MSMITYKLLKDETIHSYVLYVGVWPLSIGLMIKLQKLKYKSVKAWLIHRPNFGVDAIMNHSIKRIMLNSWKKKNAERNQHVITQATRTDA